MAIPLLQAGHLHPWVSLLFLEAPAGAEGNALQLVRHRIEGEVALRGDLTVVADGLTGAVDDLEVDGMVFRHESVPSWATDGSPWVDRHHHLAIWTRRGSLVAIYSSYKSLIGRLQAWIDGPPLPMLRRVPPQHMYAAFASGEAKVLWLAGVHPTESVKPDGKVIRGIRLQEALDRLEDQTFFDSAVRAALRDGQSPVLDKPVTSDAQESRASYGPTSNWADFVLITDAMLTVLEAARLGPGLDAPFPHLARVAADLNGVADAFEVICVNPDALAMLPEVTDEELSAAMLLQGLDFDVVAGAQAQVTVDVIEGGATAGRLVLHPRMQRKHVVIDVGVPVEPQPAVRETVESARDALRLVPPTIHYLSGHTISGRRVVYYEWRDHPFDGWEPSDFAGCDITVEKPGDGHLADIQTLTGEPGDNSLFGWVVRKWSSGWLVCDDGPDEVADFVHLSDEGVLTLIHVKASSNSGPNRRVSSEAFEQLAAQMAKNIRSLETRNLTIDLSQGPRANSSALWWEGERGFTRQDFLEELSAHPRPRLAIAVVQPHLRLALVNATREDQAAGNVTQNVARLRRVDDLLHGTRRIAAGIGASVVAYIAS